MTNTRHTPGPWHAALGLKLISDVYAVGVNGQRVFIAECATQRDALLIAAAPAMYEALKASLLAIPDGMTSNTSPICQQIRAALAQAEGHQHG